MAYHNPPILDPPKRFFSGSLLGPLPSAKSHPPEKSKTGKLRLCSDFHEHVSDLHVLAA
jgi:hypothetical protein